jgi:hypothetical protein
MSLPHGAAEPPTAGGPGADPGCEKPLAEVFAESHRGVQSPSFADLPTGTLNIVWDTDIAVRDLNRLR